MTQLAPSTTTEPDDAPAAGPGTPTGPGAVQVITAVTLLLSAAVHVAAGYSHRNAGSDHLAFFSALTIVQFLLAFLVLRRWDRRVRVAVGVVSAVSIALWLVSRTVGVGLDLGYGPITQGKEPVGVGDALCSAAELAALCLVAVPGVAPLRRRARTAVPVAAMAAGVLAGVIAVPQAAHGHDHGASNAATSISRVWAGSGHTHGALVGNGIVEGAAASCNPTDDQVRNADELVAATTLALRRFEDVDVAVKEGFVPLGFEPNGLYHYFNQAYRKDTNVLDPTRPESIVYGRSTDGSLEPVGVMYMMPSRGVHGPKPGGCLMTWHAHGFPFAKLGEASVEMVHVWTVPVPGGPFAHEAGPDWARLYLRRTPVDPAEINRLFAGVEDMVRIGNYDVPRLLDFRSLSKPRTQRCAADGRAAMQRLGLSATLQAQFCDPLLGARLPGERDQSAIGGLFRRTIPSPT